MVRPPSQGRFVVLDGIDGCGKTTQAELLVRALAGGDGPPPLHLREPGSTALGERLRAIVLDPTLALDAGVEALLMVAARRQMLAERVLPALQEGRDVVCERFHPSTFAYQGCAGGLGADTVTALCAAFAGEPEPDLIVLLELDPESARERRGPAEDRIEAKGEGYHRAVAEGFRRYGRGAGGRGARIVRVDASPDSAEVHRRILEEVRRAR